MVAIRQTHSSTFDFAKWVDELALQPDQIRKMPPTKPMSLFYAVSEKVR